jgi:hypothetical protein
MLADEGLLEAELLREQYGFAVLGQRLAPVAPDRVQRHGEVTQLHVAGNRSLQILSTSSGSLSHQSLEKISTS